LLILRQVLGSLDIKLLYHFVELFKAHVATPGVVPLSLLIFTLRNESLGEIM
jgi:hypothetical protein